MIRRKSPIKRKPKPAKTYTRSEIGAMLRKGRIKPVNRKRKAKNDERVYGPKERRKWITAFPCVVCGRPPKSDQSHLRSRSGAGRKGDAKTIVPMCRPCHDLYPQRSKWAEKYPNWPDERLEAAAEGFNRAWEMDGPNATNVTVGWGELYWGP